MLWYKQKLPLTTDNKIKKKKTLIILVGNR